MTSSLLLFVFVCMLILPISYRKILIFLSFALVDSCFGFVSRVESIKDTTNDESMILEFVLSRATGC